MIEFHFGENLCDPDEAATKFDDTQGAASDRNVRALPSAMNSSADWPRRLIGRQVLAVWTLAFLGYGLACFRIVGRFCSLYCVLVFGFGK